MSLGMPFHHAILSSFVIWIKLSGSGASASNSLILKLFKRKLHVYYNGIQNGIVQQLIEPISNFHFAFNIP